MALDVSPFSTARAAINQAQRGRDKLGEVTQQIASGVKHQDLSGFAGEGSLQTALFLKAGIEEAEGYIRSNNNATAKLDVVDQSLDNLEDVAKDLSTLIAQRLNGASGTDIPVDSIADGLLSRTSNALNVTFNGAYVFGGSKNDRPPVDNVEFTNLIDGQPTANYYQGDNFVSTVRSSANQEIAYGVKADEEPFRTLIGAAHQLLAGHAENDTEKLQAALELANDAVSQLATKRGVVRQNIKELETINITQQDISLVLEGNFSEIRDTDIVEATTRLSELEAVVQASYNAWARLSKLRLSDYVR